ncbi:electron transport complex subunit RsxB [uncultured Pseudomonas sp.]|uniref:electron transport complex subunit RsxB n=1 Tax=uncultured Pseudomonas sp. TaxID=114707 RepID=UPI0026014AC2|nr:electron transport complex subunit RsxB [uncultured Pseudomonas sp.]
MCGVTVFMGNQSMNLIQRIDALLPQTQCGKCGHAGCRPYAEGIAAGEAINKCPPGGQETIAGLAQLLGTAILPLEAQRGVAPAQVAYIREAECIGCTKCIQACPVDAIVGAAKQMHTVLSEECTGCDLCVAPCPVDCIDLLPLTATIPLVGDWPLTAEQRQVRAHKREHARQRFERRSARLQHERARRLERNVSPPPRMSQPAVTVAPPTSQEDQALKQARSELNMSRARLNKSLRAFGHPPTREQAMRLIELKDQVEAAEQALARLEALSPTPVAVPVATSPVDLKRAKIQLAMARASLNKAQAAGADAEQLARLNAQLHSAEQAVQAAQQP